MRTGFPAGSLISFSWFVSLPPLSLSVRSASECRDINLLSRVVRFGGCGSLRLGAISYVCVSMSVHACAYNCSGRRVITHFNGRKQCWKIHHAAGPPCKSWINMECEVFMLQLTADGSIPKMHGDAERGSLQLQFIIIQLGSIGKTLLLVQRVMQ